MSQPEVVTERSPEPEPERSPEAQAALDQQLAATAKANDSAVVSYDSDETEVLEVSEVSDETDSSDDEPQPDERDAEQPEPEPEPEHTMYARGWGDEALMKLVQQRSRWLG